MRKKYLFAAALLWPILSFAEVTIPPPGAHELGHVSVGYFFSQPELFFVLRIGIALLLGMLIGYTHSHRKGGFSSVTMKTYAAVCLGSASFSGVAIHIYTITGMGQVLSTITGIIQGIGFLCAAVIFKEGVTVRGLSTAATVWTTAAVGVSCGAGLFGVSMVIALFIILIHKLPKGQAQLE